MAEQAEEQVQELDETQVEAIADLLLEAQDPDWAEAVFYAALDYTQDLNLALTTAQEVLQSNPTGPEYKEGGGDRENLIARIMASSLGREGLNTGEGDKKQKLIDDILGKVQGGSEGNKKQKLINEILDKTQGGKSYPDYPTKQMDSPQPTEPEKPSPISRGESSPRTLGNKPVKPVQPPGKPARAPEPPRVPESTRTPEPAKPEPPSQPRAPEHSFSNDIVEVPKQPKPPDLKQPPVSQPRQQAPATDVETPATTKEVSPEVQAAMGEIRSRAIRDMRLHGNLGEARKKAANEVVEKSLAEYQDWLGDEQSRAVVQQIIVERLKYTLDGDPKGQLTRHGRGVAYAADGMYELVQTFSLNDEDRELGNLLRDEFLLRYSDLVKNWADSDALVRAFRNKLDLVLNQRRDKLKEEAEARRKVREENYAEPKLSMADDIIKAIEETTKGLDMQIVEYDSAIKSVNDTITRLHELSKTGGIEEAKYNDRLYVLDKELRTLEKARDDSAKSIRDSLAEAIGGDSRLELHLTNDVSNGTARDAQKGLDFVSSVLKGFGDEAVSFAQFPAGTKNQRQQHDPTTKTIHLRAFNSTIAVVHELGHWLEHNIPGAQKLCQDFLAMRVGNETPVDMVQFDRSMQGEMGRKDRFDALFDDLGDAYYVGKVYPHGSTEILSMGLQQLYSDPVKFARKDPEYFRLIISILDGSGSYKVLEGPDEILLEKMPWEIPEEGRPESAVTTASTADDVIADLDDLSKELDVSVEDFITAINDLDIPKRRLMESYLSGDMTAAEYEVRNGEFNKQIKDLEDRKKETEKRAHEVLSRTIGGDSSLNVVRMNQMSPLVMNNVRFGTDFVSSVLKGFTNTDVPFWEISQREEQRAHTNASGVHMDIIRDTYTVVHELGHWLERIVPGAQKACQKFLAERVGNEEPVEMLEEVMGERGKNLYGEFGRKDDFEKLFGNRAYYVGKVYPEGETEILSMGLEQLYRDPIKFARLDPEYFSLMVNILNGDVSAQFGNEPKAVGTAATDEEKPLIDTIAGDRTAPLDEAEPPQQGTVDESLGYEKDEVSGLPGKREKKE